MKSKIRNILDKIPRKLAVADLVKVSGLLFRLAKGFRLSEQNVIDRTIFRSEGSL